MTAVPILGDSDDIEISSGVNEELKPFCQVRSSGSGPDGRPILLLGQVSPDEVRAMALGWLEAAEAAESDALVARHLTATAGVPIGSALGFIAGLRQLREAD